MESTTIEKVFGGIAYLLGAFSKYDFFSHLEAFLQELYGPARFSVISLGGRTRSLRLEFSNHLGCPPVKDDPPVECPSLVERERRRPAGAPPLEIALGGSTLPVESAEPISAGGRCLGWILFHDPAVLLLPEGDRVGMEPFIFDHISFAYYRVDDHEQIQGKLELCEAKLSAMNGMGELIATLDVDVLLTKLMELSLFIASAQVGSVVLCGEKGIESRVEWGLPLDVLSKLRHRGGPSILERVLETGKPSLIRDFAEPEFEGVPDLQVDSYLCIPLLTKQKLLGAINLVNSADEGGLSAESILTISGLAATAIENAILHRECLEKERITANLQIARTIQNGMYPKERPRIPGYETAWANQSCDETGGDYFDFIPIDPDNLAMVIGDVSGHGIGAALLMATGRANLRALLSVKRGIREVMAALDALLAADMDAEKFMTLFLGQIDHGSHTFTYLNAGHDNPLLYHRRSREVEELPSTGLPLGILGEASEHSEADPKTIEPGDALLLMTDGVWEEVNPSRERFGKKRLIEVFARSADRSAAGIIDGIQEEFTRFIQGAERKDDFTLVAVKRVE